QAVAVSMIADEISEQDIHGPGVTAESGGPVFVTLKPVKGDSRKLKAAKALVYRGKGLMALPALNVGEKVYAQSAGDQARLILDPEAFEIKRNEQKEWLRKHWAKEGLPGTVAFVHVYSGEMDLILDHETMRWARSLQGGDQVTLRADPPMKALVKSVQPWRERTQLRLVVHSFDLADLNVGQRLHLLRKPPAAEVDTATLPPDLDRPRSKQERIEWFLASIYCTCKVAGD